MVERTAGLGLVDLLDRKSDMQRSQLARAKEQVLMMGRSFAERPADAMTFNVDVKIDPHSGNTFVNFHLTPKDFETIPPAFQRVLSDLGLTPSDDMDLIFKAFKDVDEFAITVLPKEVREGAYDYNYGIALSSEAGDGALIVPSPVPWRGSTVTIPFLGQLAVSDKWAGEVRDLAMTERTKNLRAAYAYICGNPASFNALPHPLLTDAVVGAAMWTPSLLRNRQKIETRLF